MINYLSLFSGIGAFESAMRNLDIPFEITNYCEIGKAQSKAYSLIHGISEEKNLKDITKVNEKQLGKVDFITYGFPCQDISSVGQQKGFTDEEGNKTRSGLFFDAARIIKATQPKVAIAENVKALVGKKFKEEFQTVLQTLEECGYNNYWKVLKASDYGIPQSRERVFIVSIRKDIDNKIFQFPKPYELKIFMKDFLEPEVDDKYYLKKVKDFFIKNSFNQEEKGNGFRFAPQIKNNCKVAKTITAKAGGNMDDNYILDLNCDESIFKFDSKNENISLYNNEPIRKLTERECFRLMGFLDSEFDVLEGKFTQTDLYTFAGNSIVVDVAEELLCMLFDEEGNFFI